MNWRRALVTISSLLALTVVTAAAPAATTPAQGAGDRERDIAAIRHLQQIQEEAWSRGDGRAMASTFTEDADFVTFNGDHLHTREGIAEGLQYYFDTYLQGTRLLQLDEQLRFPSRNLAVLVRTGCVLWDNEPTCRTEALSVNTRVAVKRNGKWLFETFQNTRIRPIP